MELNESIHSHAYRNLRPLKNFQQGSLAVNNLPAEVQAEMLLDEELLGIYVNSDTDPQANLVFTTRGVYRHAEKWFCTEYRQIEKLKVPGARDRTFNPQTASTMVLQCENGQETVLFISGAVTKMTSGYERRFPDLWGVLHFLDRVIERVKRG